MSEQLKPYQFKPGESGNPAGRPKGARSRATIVRELLEAIHHSGRPNVEVMTAVIVEKALEGDVTAWEKLLDSGYGKVKDVSEIDLRAEVAPLDVTKKILSHVPTEKLEAELEAAETRAG